MALDATEMVEGKPASKLGVDAASRAFRRIKRDRSNARQDRRAITGVLATLAGGIFWGFSGTCASFLFENYTVDTVWLMCARQVVSGLIFLVVILSRKTERANLVKLLTTGCDLVVLVVFAAFGVLLNQYGYLMAVKLTNAGTATVLQCLQLILIMFYSCLRGRRGPRRRELAGVVLALAGTYLLATGGNPSNLAIPFDGLVIGLVAAVGAACMSIIPARILPHYGASVVTGSGMLLSGIVMSCVFHPWANVPQLDGMGWGAFIVLAAVGSCLAYSLYMQGVKDIGSMRASLIGTVEPVSAAVTSALVLGTVFTMPDIAGFACIITMVFLTA